MTCSVRLVRSSQMWVSSRLSHSIGAVCCAYHHIAAPPLHLLHLQQFLIFPLQQTKSIRRRIRSLQAHLNTAGRRRWGKEGKMCQIEKKWVRDLSLFHPPPADVHRTQTQQMPSSINITMIQHQRNWSNQMKLTWTDVDVGGRRIETALGEGQKNRQEDALFQRSQSVAAQINNRSRFVIGCNWPK